MSSDDRRAPGTTRMSFDGLVEVGGALGPSFEAQAVNVSEDGMMLRTAYLPEPGQPLTCRFDAGGGQTVLASGEVVWTHGADKGGEFALRFTDMDVDAVESLKRLCGVAGGDGSEIAPAAAGSKVRLHIDGLAAPMRAKVRDARSSEVTVGSELGFLKVGKHLELEATDGGAKRPASIDRVEVQIDPSSHVPQLVITLRYDDATQATPAPRGEAPVQACPADDLAAVEEAGAQMKGAMARHIARVGPAIERLAGRARTTIALLAARRARGEGEGNAPKRMTAPPPGGGLHASGKKVVRGEPSLPPEAPAATRRVPLTRRNTMIGGAVMGVAILGAVALKKTRHEPPADPSTQASAEASASATPGEAPPSQRRIERNMDLPGDLR